MASSQDSEELNAWFKNRGKHAVDVWNLAAAQTQIPVWCQQLSSDDARQMPMAHVPPHKENVNFFLNLAQSQALPSVSGFTLSDDARALHLSPKNCLYSHRLQDLQPNIQKQQVPSAVQIADRYGYSTCLNSTHPDTKDLTRTVWTWLNKIPQTAEKCSSPIQFYLPGFTKQSGDAGCHPANKEAISQDRNSINPSSKSCRSPVKNRAYQRRSRLTVKEREPSRQVTTADWVALGERRRLA